MRSRKSLILEADRVFSLYVRNRGATFGWNHCFTCGAYLPVSDLQCGHFRSRRYINTRWHTVNCWPQCNRCNVELSGNLIVYEKKLRSMFGDDAIDGLFELSLAYNKITDDDIREIIKKY